MAYTLLPQPTTRIHNLWAYPVRIWPTDAKKQRKKKKGTKYKTNLNYPTTKANKQIINKKERKPRHDTLKITVPRASTHPYPMNLYFTYYLLLSACFSLPLLSLFTPFLGLSVLLSF